jgi:hypothetical protein
MRALPLIGPAGVACAWNTNQSPSESARAVVGLEMYASFALFPASYAGWSHNGQA